MNEFELMPTNGRKSFYGKAIVNVKGNNATLYSYRTKIITKNIKTGKLTRHYFEEPTCTTITHIKSFCGLNKKAFMAL